MSGFVASNSVSALAQAMTARLQVKITELEVENFPDDPDAYRLNHHLGALLVHYHGSKYGPSKDTGLVVQQRLIAMEVTLVLRSLYGDDGINERIESVRRALTGFCPPGFSKLKPISDEFISHKCGEWRHVIDFSTTTSVIEESEPEAAPLMKKFEFKGNHYENLHIPGPG